MYISIFVCVFFVYLCVCLYEIVHIFILVICIFVYCLYVFIVFEFNWNLMNCILELILIEFETMLIQPN